MPASRVILWRHGQTDLNVQRRIQGASDVPLNDVGVEQARVAARALAALNPTTIVSSPLSRAVVTAEALATELGIQIDTDERLTERSFGVWEGMAAADITVQYPEAYAVWQRGQDPEGLGIERQADVGLRVSAAVEQWAAQASGTLVIVAHGAAIKNGVVSLIGQDPSTWFGIKVMGNCRWAVLDYRPNYNPVWRIDSYNVGVEDTGESITPA